MDLGTANTLLYTRAHGIVINEPSVVAIDTHKNSVLAVGASAKEYLGRTPQRIKAVRPMKDGVIADFDITREMISYFVRKAITGMRLVKPSMVICIPTGITQVEKRAVIDSAIMAGGGSLLKGLDQFIARETRLKVFVDKDPLTTVLRGTARAMLDRQLYHSVFIN